MRAVIQRVSSARVETEGRISGQIGKGLLVLVAVHKDDTLKSAQWLVNKILGLRLFCDDEGKMNLSVDEVGGNILVVSQFTLYGDCRRGRRPSYSDSAPPAEAENLYNEFVRLLKESGIGVQEGVFQTHMDVHLVNDGPVTVIVDSP